MHSAYNCMQGDKRGEETDEHSIGARAWEGKKVLTGICIVHIIICIIHMEILK